MTARDYHPPDEAAPKRPTMRDVAAAAGVSVALVSHAYGRPGRVAPATRERILQAAAALGYAGPNQAARALKLGHSGRVGVVAPNGVGDLLSDERAVLVLRGLARACDRAGLSLSIAERFAEPLDAVVGIGHRPDATPGARVVAIEPPDDGPAVRADFAAGARQLVEHLLDAGHAGLTIVAADSAGRRAEALRTAWGDAGEVRVVEIDGRSHGHGEIAGRAMLKAGFPLDAVVATSDPVGRGLLDVFRWSGRKVPGDVAVAAMDGFDDGALVGLTSIVVPYEPLGELAGAMLIDRALAAAERPEPLPTVLAMRASTGTRRR